MTQYITLLCSFGLPQIPTVTSNMLFLLVLIALVGVGAAQENSDAGAVTDLSICPGIELVRCLNFCCRVGGRGKGTNWKQLAFNENLPKRHSSGILIRILMFKNYSRYSKIKFMLGPAFEHLKRYYNSFRNAIFRKLF